VPGGRLWIYEMDPDAPAEAIRADRAPLWGFFRLPLRMHRRMARDHGFTAAEIDTVVRPVVEKSPFRVLRTTRVGSTVRLELAR
ncbi:MAG TPA: hypothetical protein VNC59_00140, partial [Thermoanaerobaculia bacterium]|nr:hypothetical protein [Thermoanaerobaculia bacterium]